MLNKTSLILVLLLLVACTAQINKNTSVADDLIQKSEELEKTAKEYDLKVHEIAKDEFTFEKAEQARKELNESIKYYKESLDANNEAIVILENSRNSSLAEQIKQRKSVSLRTAKVHECNNLGLDLLNAIIAHGEKTFTPEIKDLMSKEKKCGEELNSLLSSGSLITK